MGGITGKVESSAAAVEKKKERFSPPEKAVGKSALNPQGDSG